MPTSSPARTTLTSSPTARASRLDATAIHFDSRNDVAVLRVPSLDRPALRFSREVKTTEPGAVLGFPLNGPYRIVPARVGDTRRCSPTTPTGRACVRRQVTAFRADVKPGNSGGPIVDVAGRVSGTVFSKLVGSSGGYAVPNDDRARRAGRRPRRRRHRALRRGRRAAAATLPTRGWGRYPRPLVRVKDTRHRREAVGRPRPHARADGAVSEAGGLPRGPRARRDLGRRSPRPARRARRVRREVQEVAHGRPADRARQVQARRARRALQEADVGRLQAAQARRRRDGRQRLRRRPRGRADLRLPVREGGLQEARRSGCGCRR